jgi:hypothetical protein
MVSALWELLGVRRVTDILPEDQRLPALLRESRRYQNEVSTALAGQVLEALWELLRGFQRADDDSKGELLREALRQDSHDVYGGLLTTLMRLVFILYAEDRGLMPPGAVYQRHYSVSGLFVRLREDQARYPDTMDARYGAWAHLLTLFRLIHDGGGHGDLRFPARHGRLFNPDAYPFLEGRTPGSTRQIGEVLEAPRVPDGTVYRVLRNLLILDGERLSYRALDVEQVGSVYEAMMGFALETASAPSIAVSPKHIVVNLEALLEEKGKDRAAWLKEHAELKIASDALARATTVADLVAALGTRVSRYTPQPVRLGAMYLQPTEERRRSGSHYTPRSLTEPIVRTTLRPIFERLGEQATPDEILGLKVCDPAMGSGAFLVEACRLLGERLVKAWEVHKSTPKVPDDEDVLTYARRLVAERCLYGVDKNIFAVDLAKLSLWLATLARDHPFTFLDHALRHGDSLVGLSREQIACLHWNPGKQLPLIRGFLDARVAEAQRLREQIQGMGSSDDVPEKARLLRDAEGAVAEVRLIGDAVASAFFERDKPRDREALRAAYAGKIENWLDSLRSPGSSDPGSPKAQAAPGLPTAIELELGGIRSSLRSGNHPIPAFHWEVEFPEVFTRANGGFDAFVGNPPFMGGSLVSERLGTGYLAYLHCQFAEARGKSDLVAYFLRRCFAHLSPGGCFGLLTTNTVAQGDTRFSSLRWICGHGGCIFSASRRIRWPGSAAVVVSAVHVVRGLNLAPRIDGKPVDRISAYLFSAGGDDDPHRLRENLSIAYSGSNINGEGFVLSPGERQSMIALNERSAAIIKTYLGGEELNSSADPGPSRYVIDFGDMEERDARGYELPFQRLYDTVRIQRQASSEERLRNRWWLHSRPARELRARAAKLTRVLASARHSPYLSFAFQSTGTVFSDALTIFAGEGYAFFAVLQARAHEIWARAFGSSLKDDLRYIPEDCFETFPLPLAWEQNQVLETVGREYYDFRAALMVRNKEGLTKTYNRFHNPDERHPDIVKLRELHDAMDRAVLDAYGWTDIQPRCEFILDYEDDDEQAPGKASKKKKPWRFRWPDEIRDGVLARLLALNARRAKEEALVGAAPQGGMVRGNLRHPVGPLPLLDDSH